MSDPCGVQGRLRPVVDSKRCEGAGDCVRVCPYDVFSVVRMKPETYRALPIVAKVKAIVHGMKTAEPARGRVRRVRPLRARLP